MPASTAFSVASNPAADAALASFLPRGGFPHAILVEGPPGSGKSTFARRIAMAALCMADNSERPCGKCPACLKSVKGIHPDLLVYESGNKGNARSFHVDEVRRIRTQAYILPSEAERKALLLEDVHTMTEQAQNALLKVLEEPPPSAVFILTCRSRGEMLDTILSRVASVTLRYPSAEACAEILSGILPGKAREELLSAAEESGGSVGTALALLSQSGGGEPGAQENRRAVAGMLLSCLESGQEAKALALLKPCERDRAGFLEILDETRALLCGRLLSGTPGRTSPLRILQLCAVIDDIAGAAAANVGGVLLCSALCARFSQILDQA